MNKTTLFIFSLLFFIVLILASCKNSETSIEEKKKCFNECMLVEENKEYCLDDCDIEENDVEESPVEQKKCGDGVCDAGEKQIGGCVADCGSCATDADCGEKELCKDAVCKPVDCTQDSHCPDGYGCESNACVKIQDINATAAEELEEEIQAVIDDIDALLEQIDGLQEQLDDADASEEDKEDIQEDIDALADEVTTLEGYKETLEGYIIDLDAAETAEEMTTVGDAFAAAKAEITSYVIDQQTEVDAIEEAIADLAPEEKPDLVIDDFDLESVDGNDGTFTITIKNDDDGNISEDENVTIRLTSFEEDGETEVDDTKTSFSDGLGADEEDAVELEVEMAYGIEQYFEDNDDEDTLVLLFLVELDVSEDISESDETNNEDYFNITFSRDDYVTNEAPTASISANATSVLVDESIFFNATGSTDSDGSISSYSWDFGDGYSSSNAEPTHSWSSAGSYTVTVTVTDDDSETDTETETITVS